MVFAILAKLEVECWMFEKIHFLCCIILKMK